MEIGEAAQETADFATKARRFERSFRRSEFVNAFLAFT
jgi:hypothetical protein